MICGAAVGISELHGVDLGFAILKLTAQLITLFFTVFVNNSLLHIL
jgi:hypothetical protein